MNFDIETYTGLMMGVGLSAACGYRVFVPLLALSIAANTGYLSLAGGFEWIGSWPALIAFATATVLEITAYYIPWLDHALDSITTPASIAAGTLILATTLGDSSPFMKWALALIAGGGAAGLIQLGTVSLRTLSGATTGGIGNPLVATLELGGAILTTLLALLVPVICLFLLLAMLPFCAWLVVRLLRQHKRTLPTAP